MVNAKIILQSGNWVERERDKYTRIFEKRDTMYAMYTQYVMQLLTMILYPSDLNSLYLDTPHGAYDVIFGQPQV